MFGLMKIRPFSCSETNRKAHRVHYCGSCKALGAVYGSVSRMFLNHDAVFMAELWTETKDRDTVNWDRKLSSGKCFTLPDETNLHEVLRRSALVHVLMIASKIGDRIADGRNVLWHIARWFFSSKIEKAYHEAKALGYPINEFNSSHDEQAHRESLAESGKLQLEPLRMLKYLAEPTSGMVGLTMASGANAKKQELMKAGAHFGRIIYYLDALEDFKKDCRRNEFNAIRTSFRLEVKKIPDDIREKVIVLIHSEVENFSSKIKKLVAVHDRANYFANLLSQNIDARIITGKEKRRRAREIKKGLTEISAGEKWRLARERAVYLFQRGCAGEISLPAFRLKLISAMLFIMPFHLWAAETGTEEPGICETIIGGICFILICSYCCKRGCCSSCCLGSAIGCFCCGDD